MAGVTINYDSLFVRMVAFPVQVAYWIKEVIAPCAYSVKCSDLNKEGTPGLVDTRGSSRRFSIFEK